MVQGLGQIESSDIVKGYEVDTDTYVTLEPGEIDALKLESKKTIDLVQIIDPKEIDYRYFEHPYFVTPAGELAGEGYVVICTAQNRQGRTCSSDDRRPRMARRHCADRKRAAHGDAALRRRVEEPQRVELIDKKSGPFHPVQFEDHYQNALKKLVQAKSKGRKIIATPEEPREVRMRST